MASVSRCRSSLLSLRKSTSLLTRNSKNCITQTAQCSRTIFGPSSATLQQTSKTSIVQAVTKRFSSQMSRNFQEKFPPVLGCNVLSIVVIENLIGSSELEESAEGEDEATSGRKRIRLWNLLDDIP
ncbi:hypothetical protein ACROYT_G035413 [Oculina patagonica]